MVAGYSVLSGVLVFSQQGSRTYSGPHGASKRGYTDRHTHTNSDQEPLVGNLLFLCSKDSFVF